MAENSNTQDGKNKRTHKVKTDNGTAITSYFSKSKKQDSQKSKPLCTIENNQSDIYSVALQIQCESNQEEPNDVSNEELTETIAKLEAMLVDEKKVTAKWIEEYNLLKEKYVSNLQLLVKAQQMLIKYQMHVQNMPNRHQIEKGDQPHIDQEGATSSEPNTANVDKSINVHKSIEILALTNDHVNVGSYISDDEMVVINSTNLQKSSDSTFIKALVEILYEDKNLLRYRSVSGRTRNEHDKQPITPYKMSLIKQMFLDRIQRSSAAEDEKISRLDNTYINRLISGAINNFNRKSDKNELVEL